MSLEIVLGPMFSGKTSYALSYVRKHRAIGKWVLHYSLFTTTTTLIFRYKKEKCQLFSNVYL